MHTMVSPEKIDSGIVYDASHPFIFDGGDMKIIVKHEGETIIGSVSVAAMIRASPVWAKLLSPPSMLVPETPQNEEDESGDTHDSSTDSMGIETPESSIDGDACSDSHSFVNIEKLVDCKEEGNISEEVKDLSLDTDVAEQLDSSNENHNIDQSPPTILIPVQQLDFTNDPSYALLILLRIAHLNFTYIPTSLTPTQLWHIAILCHKYDCVELTKPWYQNWLSIDDPKQWVWDAHENGWPFIFWVFGREERLEKMAGDILLSQVLADDAEEGEGDGGGEVMKFKDYRLPPGLGESLDAAHEAGLSALLDIPYTHLNNFLTSKRIHCTQLSNKQSCDAIICGSLIRGLDIFGMYPRPEVKDAQFKFTLLMMGDLIGKLCVHPFPSMSKGEAHGMCFTGDFKGEVKRVLDGVGRMVTEEMRVYMEGQRGKLSDRV